MRYDARIMSTATLTRSARTTKFAAKNAARKAEFDGRSNRHVEARTARRVHTTNSGKDRQPIFGAFGNLKADEFNLLVVGTSGKERTDG